MEEKDGGREERRERSQNNSVSVRERIKKKTCEIKANMSVVNTGLISVNKESR